MSDDRELVICALRRRVEEARRRQVPATHSSVEEIVAYYEGELSEEQDRELQRHLILCRDCPDLILDLDGFVHLPATRSEVPPPEMESVWRRLRRQLAAEGRFAGGRPTRLSRRAALGPLLAAALVVLLASLGLLLLRGDALRRVDTPRRDLPQLEVAAAVRGDEAVPEIGDRRAAAGFTLKASPEGPWDLPRYVVSLRRPGGDALWTEPWRPQTPTAPFLLEVPRGALAAGEYLLRFAGAAGATGATGAVEERHFHLSYH